LSEMGAQATSFYALDALAVSHLDRKRSSRRPTIYEGPKKFQEDGVILLIRWLYWYFTAMPIGSGRQPPHSGTPLFSVRLVDAAGLRLPKIQHGFVRRQRRQNRQVGKR
jgi:hypothetical protein